MVDKFLKLAMTVVSLSACGCSFLLDYDSLTTDTETECDTGDEEYCNDNSDCNDNVDCTVDSCNDHGICSYIPDNDKCDYLEMCDVKKGCIPTGRECLNDGDCEDSVNCTTNKCRNWECVFIPDDSVCQNKDLCIEDSVCDAKTGCTEGHEKICDQSEAGICEEMVCNPKNGECEPILEKGADDDEDSFLDEDCGGDDCDDSEENIKPGAVEQCNQIDDDCDGFTDITVLIGLGQVSNISGISSPMTASNLKRRVVVWQQGEDKNAKVYVRILGTGDCLVDSECKDKKNSLPASDPIDLSPLAGAKSIGMSPSITASNGLEFYVVWVATTGSQEPRIVMAGVTPQVKSGAPSIWSQAIDLSDGSAPIVKSPRIVWDYEANGWLAAWGATAANGDSRLELIDKASKDTAQLPFVEDIGKCEIGNIDIASLGQNDCALGFSSDISGKSLEVYEFRLVKNGTWSYHADYWGGPKLVSLDAVPTQVDDSSCDVCMANAGLSRWVTTFADIKYDAALDSESDIRAALSSSPGTVATLFEDSSFSQTMPSLAYNGAGFGLIYVQQYQQTYTIDFRMLDAGLSLLPTQAGRFAIVSDGSTLSIGNLAIGQDGFETVWIETTTSDSSALYYAGFLGCVE